MPAHIRHLRAMRRQAWILVALGLVGQIAGAALSPTTQSGAAMAAPIQERTR
jgi:cation transporter-like permease